MHYIVSAAQDMATSHVHASSFHLTARVLCVAVTEHVYVCDIFFRKLTTLLSPKTAALLIEYNAGTCR